MTRALSGYHPKVSFGRLVAVAVAVGTVSVAVLPVATAQAANRRVVVSAVNIGSHGKVLVSNGKTLYFLVQPAPTCGSACLAIWPALTLPAHVKSATAGPGVQKSKLGVTTDTAGARQVTYNGQPVFWFSLDKKHQVTGNITDQFGKWVAVTVGKSPSSGSGGSSSTSGSGGSNAGSGGVSF
jgi:predicted lipoprotein with Yx(FWY)xxD motif